MDKKEATNVEPQTGFQKAMQSIEETNMRFEKFIKEQKEKSKSELENGSFVLGLVVPKGITRGTLPSSTTKHDNVNSPKHYCKGGLECIEVIKAQLTKEQYQGYLYGNVLKYMWRWQDKNGLEDLRKAAKYLEWLQEEVKK